MIESLIEAIPPLAKEPLQRVPKGFELHRRYCEGLLENSLLVERDHWHLKMNSTLKCN
jgi:hypothetical protein